MFDFDAGKLLVIGIVALVVIGPKDLPRVLRQVGQMMARVRRMAGEFQGQFMQAMREADLEDVKTSVSEATQSVSSSLNYNPIEIASREIGAAINTPTSAPPVHTDPYLDQNIPAFGGLEQTSVAPPVGTKAKVKKKLVSKDTPKAADDLETGSEDQVAKQPEARAPAKSNSNPKFKTKPNPKPKPKSDGADA